MTLTPGYKIHFVTVLSLHHKDLRHRKHWLCRCRCGVEKVIQGALLTSGNTKSCGCWSREAARLHALPHGTASRNLVLAGYRHKAAKSKIQFLITPEQFSRITVKPCFYCGAEISNLHKSQHGTGDFAYNGLDRIDSKKGYSINNVVPACRRCNFAKSNRSQGEFIEWIRRCYRHLSKTAMAEQWG